jgi:hypothetical protein
MTKPTHKPRGRPKLYRINAVHVRTLIEVEARMLRQDKRNETAAIKGMVNTDASGKTKINVIRDRLKRLRYLRSRAHGVALEAEVEALMEAADLPDDVRAFLRELPADSALAWLRRRDHGSTLFVRHVRAWIKHLKDPAEDGLPAPPD